MCCDDLEGWVGGERQAQEGGNTYTLLYGRNQHNHCKGNILQLKKKKEYMWHTPPQINKVVNSIIFKKIKLVQFFFF